jgi:hypothetical protein
LTDSEKIVLPTHLLPFDFRDLATLLKIANPPIAKKQLHRIDDG